MSLLHSAFHLGAQGIISRARAVQTLRSSLNWILFIDAKPVKAPPYCEKFHFRCIS